MKITRNRREFATLPEADAYTFGYKSFPRWPHHGVNGSLIPVDHDSHEATGYYDAERDWEEYQDRKEEMRSMREDD